MDQELLSENFLHSEGALNILIDQQITQVDSRYEDYSQQIIKRKNHEI